jgi:hypothetical protein
VVAAAGVPEAADAVVDAADAAAVAMDVAGTAATAAVAADGTSHGSSRIRTDKIKKGLRANRGPFCQQVAEKVR